MERLVAASVRRPGRVLIAVALLVVGVRGAGARAAAERGHRHDRLALVVLLRGDRALPRALRRAVGRRPRAGRPPQSRADEEPRHAGRARGLPVGQQARRRARAGRREGPVRGAREDQARPGRLRPRHVHQLGGGGGPEPARDPLEGDRGGGREGGHRGPQAVARARAVQGPAGQGGRVGAAGRLRQAAARPAADQPALRARAHRRADARRPELRLRARLRPLARRADAEGALRLPVPERQVGGHPGAAEGGPDRGPAPRRDRADPRGGRDAGVEARQGELHRHRARPWCSTTSRRRSPARCCGCSSSRSW